MKTAPVCPPALRDHKARELREVCARTGDDLDQLKDLRAEMNTVLDSLRLSLESIDSGQLRMRVRDYADQLEDWISDTIGFEIMTIEEAEDAAKPMVRAGVPVSAS